jgi:hypothetical protein
MRKMRNCGRLLLVTIFVALVTSPLCAQNVPPPPKPVPDGPSLAETLESLKQTLLASDLEFNVDGWYNHRKVSGVTMVPADCSMRFNFSVAFDRSGLVTAPHTLYFESIDSARAITLQAAAAEQAQTGFPLERRTDGYIVLLNGDESAFYFPEQQSATRAAELIRLAAEICRATPVLPNEAVGKPSLEDTLQFIEQKLTNEASVTYVRQGDGESDSISTRALEVRGDPASCRIAYRIASTVDDKPSQNLHNVLSFRRARKFEVLTGPEFRGRFIEYHSREIPTVYALLVTYSDGLPGGSVQFSDEEMADRVAKAMNHAAELCGSGKRKELF